MTSHKYITKFKKEGHKQFSGHTPFATGRSTYLYCSKCFNDCDDVNEWSCNVIANLKYSLLNNADGTTCVCVKCEGCCCVPPPPQMQCTSKLPEELYNGQSKGYGTYCFPVEDIVEDTYSGITEHLENVGLDDERLMLLFQLSPNTNMMKGITFPLSMMIQTLIMMAIPLS